MKDGSSRNMPTQRSMELGLFEMKETVINRSDGGIDVKRTPKVTGRGQLYFVNRFRTGVFGL
jgi:anti-repressor protein